MATICSTYYCSLSGRSTTLGITDIGLEPLLIHTEVDTRTSIQGFWQLIPHRSLDTANTSYIYRIQNNQIIGAKPIRINRTPIIIFITPFNYVLSITKFQTNQITMPTATHLIILNGLSFIMSLPSLI